MNRIKSFSLFEEDRIETDVYQGTPEYTKVIDYIALLTKTNSSQDKDPQSLVNFLRSQGDASKEIATGNVAEIFKFFSEILKNLKIANNDLYTRISGDQILLYLDKSKSGKEGSQNKNEGGDDNHHNISTMSTDNGGDNGSVRSN